MSFSFFTCRYVSWVNVGLRQAYPHFDSRASLSKQVIFQTKSNDDRDDDGQRGGRAVRQAGQAGRQIETDRLTGRCFCSNSQPLERWSGNIYTQLQKKPISHF